MKNLLSKLTLTVIACCTYTAFFAQTSGTLTCTFTEIPKTPTYPGNSQHALAVWIQTNAGGFVKTKLRNCCGGSTFDHLPTWSVNAGGTANNAGAGNIVDATTGATKSNWGAVSLTWDGKIGPTGTGTLQPDGVYKVAIQSTWNHGTGGTATNSYTFTKGPSIDSQTITTDPNWSNIQITWTPDPTTGIKDNNKESSGINVYPNPTNGIFTVDYKNANNIKVINTLGVVVFDEHVNGTIAGSKNIDLSSFTNGIYFIMVANDNGASNHKIILNK